jgi:hypothetical protein
MALVFAAPGVPSVAPPQSWFGLQMTWTGWDGSVWDITRASEGVCMMAGVRGLSMPPVVHYVTSYASVAGSRWRGTNADAREVFWPIQIFHDLGSQAWIERERAFWRTMRPTKTGVWTVTQPGGEQRHLDCRFVDDSQVSYAMDPALCGWSNYGINMVAHQPYWRGAEVRKEWTQPPLSETAFLPSGTGDGFFISPANSLNNALVDNPGDIAAFPVWEVHGPVTTAHVGPVGQQIQIPFPIAAGKVLIIDTSPNKQAALLYDVTGSGETRVLTNETDVTPLMTSGAYFAPIPPQASVSVDLGVEGEGYVALAITPLYMRAW